MPTVFISYRRADSVAASRGIYRYLQKCFGRDAAFMDIGEIRYGTDWAQSIDTALAQSRIVLPVIGRHWLRMTNDHGIRRIDLETDWVRREILQGLKGGKIVLPILLEGAERLRAEALTGELQSLAAIEPLALRDVSWERDLKELAQRLTQEGLLMSDDRIPFPRPTINIKPLSHAEITVELRRLDGWTVTASPHPDNPHITRNELFKSFQFRSFRQAMQFMHEATEEIDVRQHHPRWENVWRTVRVWLATWDVEFQVSELDIKLADFLNETAARVMKSPP